MRELEDRGERLHERVWSLLPWYVNGTLSLNERERVEAHLAVCRRCQEEERVCRSAAGAVQGAGEVAPTPHPVQFQRVLARIDEAERQEPRGLLKGRLFAPFRALIDATLRPLRGALVAQAAIILVMVGVLAWETMRSAPRAAPPAAYRTLSDPAPAHAPMLRLRVMFSPKATERQLRELLLDVRGEITNGPSPFGVYTVEVPAGRDSMRAVLAWLRSEPQVMLAEPASGEGAR